MSIAITSINDGVLTYQVTGLLTHAEVAALQQRAAEIIQKQGTVSFLVLVSDFEGFDKAGDWGDVSFQFENDAFIKKIAIVGAKKWEELALLFTAKGIRSVAIEYFLPEEETKARAWLAV